MSNFENYDFILHDGVVIENEKADKEGRKKRMSAMCVKAVSYTHLPLGSNAFNFSRSKATAEYFP